MSTRGEMVGSGASQLTGRARGSRERVSGCGGFALDRGEYGIGHGLWWGVWDCRGEGSRLVGEARSLAKAKRQAERLGASGGWS